MSRPLVLTLVVLLIGCAGELKDPERFGLGGADANASCATGTDVVADIIMPKCASSACHDSEFPAGGLDLMSADPASRLVDVASTCNNRPLVDSAMPENSYLLEKLGAQPECGSPMPLAADPLSAGDVACVESWVGAL